MEFQDKVLVCEACQAEFVHSAADQERYAERGFKHEPKRCRTCREQRRGSTGAGTGGGAGGGGGYGARSGGGGGGGGGGRGGYGGGDRGSRPRKELFPATCAACGQPTQVPFQPKEGRPVYCRDCFSSRRA